MVMDEMHDADCSERVVVRQGWKDDKVIRMSNCMMLDLLLYQ